MDAADNEIAAILKGLERASSRIWVVSRDYHVLALAGSLKRPDPPPPSLAQRALGWLLAPPTEEFDDAIAADALAAGREIAAALQGVAVGQTIHDLGLHDVVIAPDEKQPVAGHRNASQHMTGTRQLPRPQRVSVAMRRPLNALTRVYPSLPPSFQFAMICNSIVRLRGSRPTAPSGAYILALRYFRSCQR